MTTRAKASGLNRAVRVQGSRRRVVFPLAFVGRAAMLLWQ
jgi:hypothetical protein